MLNSGGHTPELKRTDRNFKRVTCVINCGLVWSASEDGKEGRGFLFNLLLLILNVKA